MEFTETAILIGNFEIRYYGIILMLGVVAATWMINRQAERKRMNTDYIWDGLIWVVIGGVLGARLWHIFTPPPSMVALGYTTQYYLTHPLDALAIWKGGLGIPGAVIVGGLVVYWYAKKNNQSFTAWVDVIAPGVALGQAIGRWGNFINQELYGSPTTLPWAIKIDRPVTEYAQFSYFHPLFLYESIWNLGNMALLLWLDRRYRRQLKDGDLALVFLITYSIGRFLLDFLRLDASQLGGINANQTFVAFVAVGCGYLLADRHGALDLIKKWIRPQPKKVVEEVEESEE